MSTTCKAKGLTVFQNELLDVLPSFLSGTKEQTQIVRLLSMLHFILRFKALLHNPFNMVSVFVAASAVNLKI